MVFETCSRTCINSPFLKGLHPVVFKDETWCFHPLSTCKEVGWICLPVNSKTANLSPPPTYRKQRDFVILSTLSMCTTFTGQCSFIHCFAGAFERLSKNLLKVGFLEWNEQTYLRQLSETLYISVVFSRLFAFEKKGRRMRKYLNSRWWVGGFAAFWSASQWGIWPSKLQTYREFDQIFSKKSNAWRVCLRGWGEGQLEWTSSIFQRCMQGCN